MGEDMRGHDEKDMKFEAGGEGADEFEELPRDERIPTKEDLAEDQILDQRRLEIQRTLLEPTPLREELTDEERRSRAAEIAVDLINTSKDLELRRQSDEARERFITMVIDEFDQRGWTLPKNIHQVYKDDATDHDKERKKLLFSLAKEAKKGTDLM